jgi:HK97 family phage major capsid protein
VPTTHASIARENLSRRKDITGELRQIDEAATTEQRNYTESETARITELRSELEQVDARVMTNLELEIRQREIEGSTADLLGLMLSQTDSQGGIDARSVGRRFIDSPEYRAWAGQAGQAGQLRVSADMELRAVADATLASGSAGTLVVNPRLPGIVNPVADRPVLLLDVLTHIPVTQAAVEYVQDLTPAADLINRPAWVPEGGAKPDASITLGVVTEPIKTVAVHHNITRQAAADVPQFMGYVDGRLRYALRRKIDTELLSGDGTGNGLIGLLNRGGISTYAPGSAEARYRSIRHAITVMEQQEQVPEIVVLNPLDAEYFDLSNDTTAGLHAVDSQGGLRLTQARTAWGLTQVRSNAVSAGTAVIMDPTAMAIFDRQQITAYTTDSHADNFTHNILTLLLEARIGAALFNAAGVVKVTFNGSV